MNFWLFLSYFSGLHLFNPNMDPPTLLRTILLVHTCDAVMCRLFAHNNGYPRNLWTLLGFVFGIWAVAITIVLPNRNRPADGERQRERNEAPDHSGSLPPAASPAAQREGRSR